MSKAFVDMTTEELKQFMRDHRGEDIEEEAFAEYSSRLEWKTMPQGLTTEEEMQILKEHISQKTGKTF